MMLLTDHDIDIFAHTFWRHFQDGYFDGSGGIYYLN